MKNKPMREVSKFWSICFVATGFCYRVLTAAGVGNPNEERKKVIEITIILIESIPNSNTNNYVQGMGNFLPSLGC